MSDPSRYPIPSGLHQVEETIRRSRFITTVGHAPTGDAAHEFVERMRAEFPDATHHCWAFVAGPPGSTTQVGMSDAGEPHGTAGKPMLTALLHGGVGEIVAVVTRYYGGTKLGTGGLSRAYSGGVVLALQDLPTVEKVERIDVEVVVGYPEVDAFQRLMEELEVTVISEEYGVEARYRCAVPQRRMAAFRSGVADLTRGTGTVRET
jgi:uncharacterized YigZ family protein